MPRPLRRGFSSATVRQRIRRRQTRFYRGHCELSGTLPASRRRYRTLRIASKGGGGLRRRSILPPPSRGKPPRRVRLLLRFSQESSHVRSILRASFSVPPLPPAVLVQRPMPVRGQRMSALIALREAPDVFADAALVDDAERLLFLSLWGRDTSIQHCLAMLSLPTAEGGSDELTLTDGTPDRLRVTDVDQLTRHTGRVPNRRVRATGPCISLRSSPGNTERDPAPGDSAR